MSWREIDQSDLAWVEAFLREHIQSSMFFLGNLRDHGLGSAAPRGLQIWARTDGAPALFARTNEGMILLQAPDAAAADWQAAGPLWQGRAVLGVLGEAQQAALFLEVSGLNTRPTTISRPEPGYRLALDALQMPDCAGFALCPITPDLQHLAEDWRADYNAAVMGLSRLAAEQTAKQDIAAYMARDSHRILLREGVPVAMTGFNASLPDVVQIGGVYTPPEQRGQGLARRAVALHLEEAKKAGVTQAILFAASAAAARAYEAIGFELNGQFTMALFADVEAHAG
ncbi:GNAT family N-acetyltransferase [Shimia sp. R9_3]|uniref:GNAT family N-acetyltransferase n=1 Tax=Shimia sp. R9_3 TaxID=2821113 RepID=UPI001AD9EB68|nr:GNAT family N-acetyltransferase [Shimia sp. R9_3]MBO9403000.1 GNAT family N-acetyltransferase [Shimia sp. R9_3]